MLTWSRVAAQSIVASGRPPAGTEVLMGIVHIAIADTVAGLGHGRQYVADVRPDRSASAASAVATAAYDVLKARAPGAALETAYTDYLAGVPDGRAKTRGIALGRAVAADVLAWRAGDGFEKPVTYVQRPPGPGAWEPTAATPPVDLVLTQVRPLVLRSRAQFRPDGPDPLTSKRYARDVAEVASLGRKDGTARSARQTETAMFWAEHTAQQWSRALVRLAEERHLGLSEAARMLALVHVTIGDALIACWEAKYHYRFWRPVHAIQRADSDGNPRTTADPTWQPLLGANHPDYPSGHACFTAGATRALQAYFHTSRVPLTIDSLVTGTARSYDRLPAIRAEVQEARILSGLHFRHAMQEGDLLGTQVANWVTHRFR
ncbi:phosphatase PAP2 family protein [Kribbella turkmenica]|uniref:Phosphatase PAP2 family protein n=1 Tax=Kribbella turkmenica TaxID=2530375 RepID=A0A4R4X898_9ACTN|nr:vanadium-dependent haloperoxidase [Kribbella turkmenica]TDD26700.1 phosphatase PAP2 family protein [Kribbella turkmenica]